MATKGEKINVLFPTRIFLDMQEVVKKEGKWISIQEFVREAVYEKIEKIKKENIHKYDR